MYSFVSYQLAYSKLHFPIVVPPHRIKTTMMKTPTGQILSILKDRDISIRRDVIDSAFEDVRNVEWASKHLRPDTLLSKEELAL
jgi:hypothetical protein